MAAVLAQLVGCTISTLTGRPNRILALRGALVEVATERSPEGESVPVSQVQDAANRLFDMGSLFISVATVGYRSAFVGAVLSTLPGVGYSVRPRRVYFLDRQARVGCADDRLDTRPTAIVPFPAAPVAEARRACGRHRTAPGLPRAAANRTVHQDRKSTLPSRPRSEGEEGRAVSSGFTLQDGSFSGGGTESAAGR